MGDGKVLGEIFPAHADLQPILKRIREKHGLPELGSFDENLTKQILSDKDIPWVGIKSEK